nr:Chain B, HEXIM Arginine Rich Motif [Homo sapiens]
GISYGRQLGKKKHRRRAHQ